MHTFKLSIVLILMAGFASAQDCSKLNTDSFLEEMPWDEVLDCAEKDPVAFQKKDQQGHNLLMTAVGASIHPFELDDLISAVPEDKLDDIMSAKDIRGRGLGHIAAAEARDSGMFAILSRYGVSLIDEIGAEYGSDFAGWTPLHFAVQREDSELAVAALLAMGAVNQAGFARITPFELAMKKKTIGSEALMLAEGNWPTVYRQKFAHVWHTKDADRQKLAKAYPLGSGHPRCSRRGLQRTRRSRNVPPCPHAGHQIAPCRARSSRRGFRTTRPVPNTSSVSAGQTGSFVRFVAAERPGRWTASDRHGNAPGVGGRPR